jgi:hypothetical protein
MENDRSSTARTGCSFDPKQTRNFSTSIKPAILFNYTFQEWKYFPIIGNVLHDFSNGWRVSHFLEFCKRERKGASHRVNPTAKAESPGGEPHEKSYKLGVRSQLS